MKKYKFSRADRMDFIGLKYPNQGINCTNIITSNLTDNTGDVKNTNEINADLARIWVDDIRL